MSTTWNYLLVPTHDTHASARFLAEMLALENRDHSIGSPSGYFTVVQDGPTGPDFADMDRSYSQHHPFATDDALSDRTLNRLRESGRPYSADPGHQGAAELNDYNGGRGLYFHGPNGHHMEVLRA